MYPHQTERLEGALARLGVQAIIATSVANVAYVTGFRSLLPERAPATDVFAVYAKTGTALVIPALEAPALAASDVDADHVVCYGRLDVELAERADPVARRAAELIGAAAPTAAEGLAAVLRTLAVLDGALGLDSAPLTDSTARAVAERLASAKLHPASAALAEARAVKAPYEIECLQQALRIAEESINEVLGELNAGTTEREAAAVYVRALERRGARSSGSVVVAFGPNTAFPVMAPTDRALRTGDFVRFDVGCVFKGYHADVARMAVLGEPTPRQEARFDAVEAGVEAALATVAPGTAARRVLEASIAAVRAGGIPVFAADHVGHGTGLEAVEPPSLAADGSLLEPGMVLRVDVPAYELGMAGIQLKETVLVQNNGAAVMNRSNRGLIVLD